MSSSPVSVGPALSLLMARTGSGGASAATLTLGGEGRPDAASLRETLRAYQDAGLSRLGSSARAVAEAQPDVRKRSRNAAAAAMTKARIADMAKALARLRSGNPAGAPGKGLTLIATAQAGNSRAFSGVTSGAIDGFYTGAGNDALTLNAASIANVYTGWSRGAGAAPQGVSDDDAVALEAARVSSVHTGDGQDAVTIRAEVVTGLHTGVEARSGQPQSPNDNDAVAIDAGFVDGLYTGDGADAVAIRASIVNSVYTGRGGDKVSIHAGALGNLQTEEGDDVVTVDAVTGISTSDKPEPTGPLDAAGRMQQALTRNADIHLGAGNDMLTLKVADTIAVSGGTGDDLMHLSGGTVALHYAAGDGRDTVMLGAGTTLAIQMDHGVSWKSAWDGEALVLSMGSGSIRIYGAAQSAGIGVIAFGETEPTMLFTPPTLDQQV